jgi:integrase
VSSNLAAKSGYSLHEVRELLGHSTIKRTSDLYLHLFEDAKEEKAAALGGPDAGGAGSEQQVAPFERASLA